ncbi:hypothetical protein ACM642_15535 [Chryseobacterium sp. CY353]
MKKLFIITVLFITKNIMYAQGGGIGIPLTGNQTPVSLPLAPEAYSLLKFDINPVNLNTGIPDITESLYTFSVDDYIKLNIDLRYHPSGLRVQETSGLVGQGWNIFSPGIISRETNGLPDEKFTYGILNNGFINALNTYGLSAPQATKYLYDSKVGKEDVEYDIFHFNFLNHSGSFKLNNNGSYASYIGTSGNYHIHFEMVDNILKFTITDDRGYSYVFDKKIPGYDSRTLERVLNYEHSCDGPLSTLVSNELNPSSIWYLTKIKNPQGVILCTFSYDANTELPPQTIIENYNVRLGGIVTDVKGLGISGECEDGTIYCNHKSLLPLNERTVIQNTPALALTKIEVPGKGTVDYEIINHRIQSISIKNTSNTLIKKIAFNYLSFPSTQRHFLNTVTIKNRLESHVYKYGFEYYDLASFPGKTSEITDFWGYYNAKASSDLIIRSNDIITDTKRTDKEAVKTGSLTKILLPTGGYKDFEFESNTYSKELSNPDMIFDADENKEYTSKNESKTIFNATQTIPNGLIYFQHFQNINMNFSATQFQRLDDVAAVRVRLVPIKLTPANPGFITQAEIDNAEEEDESNTILARPAIDLHIANGTTTSNNFYTQGYYKIVYTFNMNGVLQWYPVNYNLSIIYYNLIDNIRYNYGGGLRIKKISLSEGTDVYSKNYDYHKIINNNQPPIPLGPLSSTISSGEIINTPIYKKTHSYNYLSVSTVNTLTGPIGYAASQNYLSANNLGYSSVNVIKGSIVNYKNVKVTDNKGKVENTFSVYSDYPDISFASVFSPMYKFRNQDYKVGLLLNDKIYNSSNQILKETNYEYDIRDFSKDLLYKVIDNNGGCFLQNGPLSYRVKNYDAFMNSQNASPHPSTECGHPLSNAIMLGSEVKYGFAGVKKINETENLNGISIEKSSENLYNTRYYIINNKIIQPSGENQETTYKYAHEKGNTQLINANIIGIPLEVSVTEKETPSAGATLVSKSETKYDDALHLFPSSAISYNLASGIASTQVTFNKYDVKGNILQYTAKDGIPTSIIWGYNGTQPIAKIEGAVYDDIKNNPLITAIINASDADAANPATESSLIAALDALRNDVNFKSFQMATFTYDPLIGVTTLTPPSGIREIYRYDSANRLEKIIDDEGKILKEYKYNYKP